MNKLINTNDRMVVTREKGQWEQEEEGKGVKNMVMEGDQVLGAETLGGVL